MNSKKSEYESAKENARLGMGTSADVVISEGIPLPEHHGRLIDADVLSKRLQELADDEWNQQVMVSKGLECAVEIIDNAPTIIEAESEE